MLLVSAIDFRFSPEPTMGQTLSEPVTEKHSSKDSDHKLAYGASAMQGWRLSMCLFLSYLVICVYMIDMIFIVYLLCFNSHGGCTRDFVETR